MVNLDILTFFFRKNYEISKLKNIFTFLANKYKTVDPSKSSANDIKKPILLNIYPFNIIINVTGQQAVISLGNTSVISSYLITGQQINASVNSIIVESESFISISGQQVNTSIGTYAISGDGSMTIVVPELEVTTSVGNPLLSTNDFVGITGQGLITGLGTIIPQTENLISISL